MTPPTAMPARGLILSGGRGTRLRPLTYTRAKQLVPVANKPVLFYGIEALVEAGIREIGIITGETGPEVQAAVGDGSRWGAEITCIPQGEPLGLAHAVLVARTYLGELPFVMYLGDNLIRDPLRPILEDFLQGSADATVLLARVRNAERLGVAVVEDGRIVKLVEKPDRPPSDLAVVGVILLRAAIFEAIERIVPSARGELEMTDALQQLIDDGHLVTPRIISGWWKDTGHVEDMLEANRIMLDLLPHRVDGTLGENVRLEGRVVIESGATLHNAVVRGPAIIGHDTVIEDAYVGPFTSIHDHCTLRDAEIEHSIVLEGSHIENVAGKIEDSLIGRGCTVRRSPVRPRGHKLVLGDQSSVELA